MWAQNILLAVIGLSAAVIVANGLFSFVIEFSQLLFHLGTFQISDLVYNTLGGTIGGLDLMAVFTKNFWDKKGRDRCERTLEVLRAYGDSTTVLINKPIEQIIR